MASNHVDWGSLPVEIQLEIARFLPSVGGKCSELATVCSAWQSIIEPLNFAEISLTLLRVWGSDLHDILFRKRHLVRYIWFRVELKRYDCTRCTGEDDSLWGMDSGDNDIIKDAFHTLLTGLSTWEPRGDLVLDISVYSPSDNKHWFKYLTFCSDTDVPKCPTGHDLHDPAHGWTDGRQTKDPEDDAIERNEDEMMEESPFSTRRRYGPPSPASTSTMSSRGARQHVQFPNMKDLCYEPWREWDNFQIQINQRTETLIESFASTQLCNMTIFENFNETYPEIFWTKSYPVAAVRVPDMAVSQKLARTSLHLTTLSASFLVDASDFFEACRESWRWYKLTSLALTSGILTANAEDINRMLQNAAEAALQMPKLDTMEIWNGRRDVAMVFRYEGARDRQPAKVTVRGT